MQHDTAGRDLLPCPHLFIQLMERKRATKRQGPAPTELNQYSVLHPALRPDLGSLLSPFQGQRACACSSPKKTRVLVKPLHAERTQSV
ncbi:hypothetical protein PGIGA_G00183790 [Pangasianodon gigas]|uniref:Uncharacterized protein n=1 Tax=Pangasianodon gigas TaxID=30993 RepID=A0ACC5WAF0_PANGG|nr:hypothetical protein [Pangasianodon gigas]